MIKCPIGMSAFEFSVLSGLRAAQLVRGCRPRVAPSPKVTVTARQEVAEGLVVRAAPAVDAAIVESSSIVPV